MWIIILHTSHYKYKNTSAVSQPSVLKWITTPKDGYVHYYYYVWFGSIPMYIHHILFLNNSTVSLQYFAKLYDKEAFFSLSPKNGIFTSFDVRSFLLLLFGLLLLLLGTIFFTVFVYIIVMLPI
jgi:hypothetical protein